MTPSPTSRTYGVPLNRSDTLRLPRHPDTPSGESWRSWVARQDRPLAVDLFSGAGGLSLGLEQAGYRVVLAVDNDGRSLETHRANFPGLALGADLSDEERVDDLLDLLGGLELDLIAGGPPCQPFSRAARSKIRHLVNEGVRAPEDHRRELWRVFLRMVEELRPRTALLENVPDMALGDDCRTVRHMAGCLERAGYETEFALVDAWRHGVPQHRQRLILVAVREGIFEWPKDVSPEVTVGDAISDLPRLKKGTGGRVHTYDGPLTEFQRLARAGVQEAEADEVHDHMTRAVRPDDLRTFRLMGQGIRYADLPPGLRRYRADIFDDKYHRLTWDDRSRSITAHIAKDGYWYIHPEEHRTLTVREAARIQTFPDHFRFAGARSHAFSQIGNAVPPALARSIAGALLDGAAGPTPDPSRRASARRAQLRRALLGWESDETPPWVRVGRPWDVLVGTLCGGGRGGRVDPGALLDEWPGPESVTPTSRRRLVRRHLPLGTSEVVRRVAGAGKAVHEQGWDDPTWELAGRLGPAQRSWVRVVGLGREDIAVTSGTLRVTARLTGTDVDIERRRSDGPLALARLLGDGAEAGAVTAALARLGAEVCRPRHPDCEACPAAGLCATAGAVA